MANIYYLRIHIESKGTDYLEGNQNITKSLTGHIWYEVYEKDANEKLINKLKEGVKQCQMKL